MTPKYVGDRQSLKSILGQFQEYLRFLSRKYEESPFCSDEPLLPFLPSLCSLRIWLQRFEPQSGGTGLVPRCQDYQLHRELNIWLRFAREFSLRLARDWPKIRSSLLRPHDRNLKLKTVRSLGDQHGNGKSVLGLQFSNESHVIYKPTCQQVFLEFQQLVAWLNRHGDHPNVIQVQGLDCGDYAWLQHIAHRECRSHKMTRRFYQRAGAITAVLQMLQTTDIHFQNVIACGENPVVVDLETLFHPRISHRNQMGVRSEAERLSDSVTRIGILPKPNVQNLDDISGLGAPMPPSIQATSEKNGSGFRAHIQGRQMSHRPTINGRLTKPTDYLDDFAGQFAETYRLLVQKRGLLLAETGPLANFARLPTRIVLRPSAEYFELIRQCRDSPPEEIRAVLESLPSNSSRFPTGLIDNEVQSIKRYSIPLFLSNPSSTDIWTEHKERIQNVLSEPGLNVARRRLVQMCEADLEFQLVKIHESFSTNATCADKAKR